MQKNILICINKYLQVYGEHFKYLINCVIRSKMLLSWFNLP